MTRKKNRRAAPRPSHSSQPHPLKGNLPIQNPNMIAEASGFQIQNPNLIDEEEHQEKKEIRFRNLISIEDENVGEKPHNPKSIDVDKDEDLEMKNPKSIDVDKDGDLDRRNPKSIDVDKDGDLQRRNPKSIDVDKDEDLEMQNPNESIDVDKDEDLEMRNPNESIDVDKEENLKIGNPISIEGELVVRIPISVDSEVQNPSLSEEAEAKGWKFEDDRDQEGENQQENLQEKQQQKQGEEEKEQENEELEGMAVSPTLSAPNAQDSIMYDIPEHPTPSASNAPRKFTNKRKKPMNQRQKAALEKKVQVVKQNLRPKRFVPSKILDFAKHEELLKRLGLWEFAHIEFDHEIRTDLLALLLVSYNPQLRGSTVNDCKIKVTRPDLARALKLPIKKDKAVSLEASECDSEGLSQEAISFVMDFVSNWILLQGDMWIMPNEVQNWMEPIRNGQPQKVDWAGLVWFMVEKELQQVPQLKSCYYASHLQWLMKSQKPELFEEEEPRREANMNDREETADVKYESLEDFQGQEPEKDVELCLGLDNNENEQQFRDENGMDVQQCKEEPGDPSHWFLDGKNDVNDHFLRRCNLNDVQDLGSKHLMKEVNEEEGRYDLSPKGIGLDRLASTDLLQAMGTANVSYSPTMHIPDPSGEFFHSRAEPAGPTVFSNGCKRELSHEDGADHHIHNDQHKRMRNDGSWDNKSSDFENCMEQINSWMSKARMMYAAKEQECLNARMSQEIVETELEQQRNLYMLNFQKASYEVQRKDDDIYKLEHELRVMSNLLEGYRKALKETRRAFAEYRELNPKPVEPLYKDVSGPGGVVLSTMELQKRRLAQEEEEKLQRCVIERMIMEFQITWSGKFEAHLNNVHLMGEKLSEIEHEVGLLKETVEKSKEKQGSVPKEAEAETVL